MLSSRLIFPPFANPTFIPSMLMEIQGYMNKRGVLSQPILDLNISLFNDLFKDSEDVLVLKNQIIYRDHDQYVEVISRVINEWLRWQAKYVELAREYVCNNKPEWLALMQNQLEQCLPLSQVIGLSLTYHQRNDVSQFWMTLAIATWIKQISPKTIVILGGSLVNHLEPKEILHLCKSIDMILLKESEESFVQVIQEKPWSDIPNAVYRTKKEVLQTCLADNLLRDLDYLPSTEGIVFTSYLTPEPVISLLIKRGCPWGKCSFCSGHLSYFGHHPNENWDNVQSRLVWLRENKINYIYWGDQMLMVAELKKLANLVKRHHPQLKWAFMAMPNASLTLEVLSEIAAAGCSWITWGVESGSAKVLHAMNKPVQPEVARENIIAAYSAGIVSIVLMMYGFPGETPIDLEESKSFLQSITPYYYDHAFGGYHVTIGSPVYDNPEKFGISLGEVVSLDADNLSGIRSHLVAYSPFDNAVNLPPEKRARSIPTMEGMMLALEYFRPKSL
ncbi:MAG: radical SAM protein [Candidatus Margulisbacteria bacterium]|nr:radical SAM protein [Candidatus Margulisiibacteriota bacterium]